MTGRHGDGKGGEEGDQHQSPRDSDGQWTRPIPPYDPTDRDTDGSGGTSQSGDGGRQ
jgi:hypothetical protein